MPLIQNRGHRIRASDKSLVFRFTAASLSAVFCVVVLLLNARQLMRTDWNTYHFIKNGSIQFTVTPYLLFTAIIALLVCFITAALHRHLRRNRIKQLMHRQKLARMILENKWYETEQIQDGGFFTDRLIRDSLFAIQVKQPWLLLQYGISDIERLGADRVESLLAAEPDTDAREDVVKGEIENKDNANLSVKKTMSRMGTVFFLFFFNIGISIFVFLLTGMMIFSQVLFIIFAMFLPVSFLLSMIPTFEGKSKEALTKLFNTIMMRAGITLIITVAFSISTMLYKISTGYPFFLVAFLQIVTFAGIYFKLGDLMGMFSLHSSDSQQMGRRMFGRPYRFMRQRGRRIERTIGRSIRAGAATVTTGAAAGAVAGSLINSRRTSRKKPDIPRPATSQTQAADASMGKRTGAKVGAVLDSKNHIKDKALAAGETVRDMPTQARYAVHSGVRQLKENAADFKRGMVEEQASRQQVRLSHQNHRRQTIAQKRMELERANDTTGGAAWDSPAFSKVKNDAPANHERPAVKPMRETPIVKAATVEPAKRGRTTEAYGQGKPQTSWEAGRQTNHGCRSYRTCQRTNNA